MVPERCQELENQGDCTLGIFLTAEAQRTRSFAEYLYVLAVNDALARAIPPERKKGRWCSRCFPSHAGGLPLPLCGRAGECNGSSRGTWHPSPL